MAEKNITASNPCSFPYLTGDARISLAPTFPASAANEEYPPVLLLTLSMQCPELASPRNNGDATKV